MRVSWTLGRLLPSAVRVRVRSRSTSARPPNAASIKCPLLVPVSAYGSARQRNCLHNPPHPGEIIKELCLEPLSLSVTDAARGLGVTRKALSKLLNGHAGKWQSDWNRCATARRRRGSKCRLNMISGKRNGGSAI
jgi:hypothetical protein